VNTHAVFLKDLFLLTLIGYSCLLTLSVARSAKFRDVFLENGRLEIVFLKRPMRIVAIGTVGSVRIPAGMIDSMLTVVVQIYFFSVAHGAVDLTTVFANGVSALTYVRMALDAGIGSVGGMYQLVLVDIK